MRTRIILRIVNEVVCTAKDYVSSVKDGSFFPSCFSGPLFFVNEECFYLATTIHASFVLSLLRCCATMRQS